MYWRFPSAACSYYIDLIQAWHDWRSYHYGFHLQLCGGGGSESELDFVVAGGFVQDLFHRLGR